MAVKARRTGAWRSHHHALPTGEAPVPTWRKMRGGRHGCCWLTVLHRLWPQGPVPLAFLRPASTASCGGGSGSLGLPAVLHHMEVGPHRVVSLSSCSQGTAAAARVQTASRLMLVIHDIPPGKAPCWVLCWGVATFSVPWPCFAINLTVFVTLALREQSVPQPVDSWPAIGVGWRRPGVLLGAVPATVMHLKRDSLVLPVLGGLLLPLVPGALHSTV